MIGQRAHSLCLDAVAWQRTGEDWTGADLSFSTARTTLAAEPPQLGEDVLLLVDRTPEERKTIEVDLREVEIQSVGPSSDEPVDLAAALSLPGVDDGGEARTLVPSDRVTVRSDGRPHRVRLTGTLPRDRAAARWRRRLPQGLVDGRLGPRLN